MVSFWSDTDVAKMFKIACPSKKWQGIMPVNCAQPGIYYRFLMFRYLSNRLRNHLKPIKCWDRPDCKLSWQYKQENLKQHFNSLMDANECEGINLLQIKLDIFSGVIAG